MIERLTKEQVPEVLAYFSGDLKNCLYSYIDLKKYGIEHPNLEIYVDRSDEIHCVITRYFKGINLFSMDDNWDVTAVIELLEGFCPPMINAPKPMIEKLMKAWKAPYIMEVGHVTELLTEENLLPEESLSEVEEAKEADLLKIAKLICTDEGVGGTYEPHALRDQLLERKKDQFGRNYCIRQGEKIICHAATYAEVEDLAVISGVITDQEYRGQNLAYKVVSKLGRQLIKEGKKPCLFYYTDSARHLYEKAGFLSGTPWAKLIRK